MKRLFWVVVAIIAMGLPLMWLRPIVENQTWWGAGLGLLWAFASVAVVTAVIVETTDHAS